MPIIWRKSDGSVLVSRLEKGFLARNHWASETVEETVLRLADVIKGKDPALKGLESFLVKSADMPIDRDRRDAWRLSTADGTGRVIVDANVPALTPSPAEQARAELLALDPQAVKPEDLPGIVERLQKVL